MVILNGDPEKRYPGCLNLSFAYIEGEAMLMALKGVALSSGSACTSASLEPSYVLRAVGADEDLAHSSIRFGIGRFTTEEEIDFTIDLCVSKIEKYQRQYCIFCLCILLLILFFFCRLRDMSPLWDMVKEGIDLKTINWSQH